MAGFRFAKVERDGHTTLVTIDRPEVSNALHRAAHEELANIFDLFAADDDQWVAIITGAGTRAFCAGNDLKVTAQDGVLTPEPPQGFAGLTSRFDLSKPVIAAVNGNALGGGFETVLACDIVVAADTAQFGLPEPRVGLAAMAGGLHRLGRAVGEKRALDIVLTCRRVSAQEGLAWGFVNYVVQSEALLSRAKSIANEICLGGPLSIRASKAALLRGWGQDLAKVLGEQFDYPEVKALYASVDFKEGPKAFMEKRMPIWTGK
jgi:acetyl-CoA C-acetyltransferase